MVAPGAVGAITDVMTRGNLGQARIPGKHGGAPRRYAELEVLIPDSPGEMGRLFSELGEAGVSIEDFVLEHSAGQQVGVGRIMIDPSAMERAVEVLEARAWRLIPH